MSVFKKGFRLFHWARVKLLSSEGFREWHCLLGDSKAHFGSGLVVRVFKKVPEMALSLGECKANLGSCRVMRCFKMVPEMALSLGESKAYLGSR